MKMIETEHYEMKKHKKVEDDKDQEKEEINTHGDDIMKFNCENKDDDKGTCSRGKHENGDKESDEDEGDEDTTMMDVVLGEVS
ncbi:hypothetical protein GOP47_0013950 [Adiantum capillus-veneris]|uniref:Uncharacterized protein n=1 Tax=Adiantum capillus-veneris TaxID=13818 RepID=A0A9D4UPZ7_ADICA|nr:hypothetical protein GOP47_0013950 [Adiantum capillus-veneris]